MMKAAAEDSSEQLKDEAGVRLCGLRLFLLIFWPILLVIVVAIRLQSPGSAIFAQVRVGKDGRPFTCYKLRTMYTGTENVPTHQVEASSVTVLGEYLRRFKIDEIPQLCNVVAGDMSIVGPRPCLPSQTDLIEARRQLGVLDVRPGSQALPRSEGSNVGSWPSRQYRRAICPEPELYWRFEVDLGHLARTRCWHRSGRSRQGRRLESDRHAAVGPLGHQQPAV